MSDDLVARLDAASHDERLSTGMLYREAAARVRELEARVESMRHDDWGSLRRDNDALRNGYGEIRDMCCRSPRKGLDDRIVAYIDAALAQGEKPC